MGSSWSRGQTNVHCIARWILNHWTTREALCLAASVQCYVSIFTYTILYNCRSFILRSEMYAVVWTYWNLFIQCLMGIWVVSCKSIMNHSAVNILIHVFSEIYTFVFDIYLRVVLVNHWKCACFTLVGKCHIIFQSGCNHFHSHQQSWRVSFAPYTCWILSVFLHLLRWPCAQKIFFPH